MLYTIYGRSKISNETFDPLEASWIQEGEAISYAQDPTRDLEGASPPRTGSVEHARDSSRQLSADLRRLNGGFDGFELVLGDLPASISGLGGS